MDTQQKYDTAAKQLEEAREEAKRASTETERLLQLIQMTQEEQNAKEKTIMDLQQ
jgi:golgin subfamily B member 1